MKVITIGRGQENDYVISDPGVSKYNTQIIKTDDGRFLVVDMGSVNGTYVNGKRITGEYPLKAGDVVIVANVSLDWQKLFAEPSFASPVPQKKSKGGWVLSIILGVVAVALLAGFAFFFIMAKKEKTEDVKKIENLSKEKIEFEEKVRDSEKNYELKEEDLELYGEALDKARKQKEQAENQIEIKKQELQNAEKQVKELKIKADADLDAEKNKYNELLKESKAKQRILNDQIGLSEKSVAELKAQQDTLTKQLREAEDALKQAQDTYVKRMEELREFMKQLEEAKVKDITPSMICDALKYDYVGKDPEEVLYEKFQEGHGNEIRLKIKGMIQVFGNKQQ